MGSFIAVFENITEEAAKKNKKEAKKGKNLIKSRIASYD
jgi:hypothetical protein